MILSAVIFDLNGTILEDEDEYSYAFLKVLKSLGVTTTSEESHKRGIGVIEDWQLLIKNFNIKTNKTPEVLAQETQEEYIKQLPNIRVRNGFDKFAEKLKDSGVKIALATSNTWEVAEKVLEVTGLIGVFDCITTTDEVKYNKPDPDLFTLTADKLGVERHECLVVEDADSGVEAAHRAGMKVAAFRNIEEADLLIEGFAELTPQAIDQL
jgi:HAD superfamily hydrolase (TIGR01509 family)